jgi:ABC-type transport system substrate-binding protein
MPNGFNLKLHAVQSGSFSQGAQVAEAVAGYWERVGIKASIVPIDIGSIRPKYVALAPDVVGTAMTFTSGPRLNGLDDMRVWWTRGAKVMQLAELDHIVQRAGSAKTVDEISSLVKEGYHIVYNDYRSVPIANVDAVIWGLSKKIGSIEMIPHRGVIEPSLATAAPSL